MLRSPLLLSSTRSLLLRPCRPSHRCLTSRDALPRTHGTLARTPPWGRILTGVALALGFSPLYTSHSHLDSEAEPSQVTQPPLRALLRAYFVYTMCSVPALVDASPRVLQALSSVPGLRQLTEAFVRITFFDHFVGGDTARDTLPLLRALRAQGKGVLLAYSVEVDENEATASPSSSKPKAGAANDQRIVDEMINCIDVAADFEDSLHTEPKARRTWVAVKMTALLPNAHALIHLSSHILHTRPALVPPVPFPGCPDSTDLDALYAPAEAKLPSPLTEEDITSLRALHAALVRICTRARERGVKVIMDAEYSWYQPAIDALTLALMREFNRLPDASSSSSSSAVQPLVYGTYQAYLRRTPLHLIHALADAQAHHYALGVKLVRGAYHPHEIAAYYAASASSASSMSPTPSVSPSSSTASTSTPTSPRGPASLTISPDPHPPVWPHKDETDMYYNECVALLARAAAEDAERCRERVSVSKISGWIPFWWGTKNVDGPGKERKEKEEGKEKATPPSIGILFGTHNWESCGIILDELIANGLAVRRSVSESAENKGSTNTAATTDLPSVRGKVEISREAAERVVIGQLYGMSDDLTASLVLQTSSPSPFVIKYVPYGALAEVMPYLSRRAIENKSILSGEGGAAKERRLSGEEIRRRLWGGGR